MRVPRPRVGVLAIMRDKDYPAMIAGLPAAARPRGLHAGERAAQPHGGGARGGRARAPSAGGAPVPVVEAVADPHAALARARELAGPEGSVLIGGSLYLLEDLRDVLAGGALEGLAGRLGLTVRIYWRKSRGGVNGSSRRRIRSVRFLVAFLIVIAVAAVAFFVGYLIGMRLGLTGVAVPALFSAHRRPDARSSRAGGTS